MSTEPEAPAPTPADSPSSGPTRRTFIATTSAVGGVVIAGGAVGGGFPPASDEAPRFRLRLEPDQARGTLYVRSDGPARARQALRSQVQGPD